MLNASEWKSHGRERVLPPYLHRFLFLASMCKFQTATLQTFVLHGSSGVSLFILHSTDFAMERSHETGIGNHDLCSVHSHRLLVH